MFSRVFSHLRQSSILKRARLTARRLAATSSIASRLYYVFNGAFAREQYCVVNGIVLQQQQYGLCGLSSPVLRRNVHRIEKGLLMRPRRKVFARDYILETVEAYDLVARSQSFACEPSSEVQWASDVLMEYFSIVESDFLIDKAKAKFQSLVYQRDVDSTKHVPYRREVFVKPPVSYEDFAALSKIRRSVRWFQDRVVPRELLDKALLVAAQSPSACNRQPYNFHVIDDRTICQNACRIPGGTGGYSENIPVFIVITGKLSNYADEADRHLIYIDSALAAMGFVYAAETLGLGTCLINWQDDSIKEDMMSQLLKLAIDERPVVCLAVGYPDPDGLVAYSAKKDLSVFRQYHGAD